MNADNKSIPNELPKAVSTAVIRPQATALATTNITLGPGMRIIATLAMISSARARPSITDKTLSRS
jgi:hypothetical protein